MNAGPLLWSVCLLCGDGQPPSDAVVSAAIERSLPFIESEGQRWIDEKKCVTCHQVPFMVWALDAAADKGIVTDEQKIAGWKAWATDWKNLATKEDLENGQQHTLTRHNDPVAQLLLGRSARDGDREASWPAIFAERLAAAQQDDGSWKAGGQLPSQKRPQRETQEVTTMWSLLALQSFAEADNSLPERFAKGRLWLGDQMEGQSAEWWAAKLLLERCTKNARQAIECREELLRRQHDDGGWGWLTAEDSDAFGTGVALYALASDGEAADQAAVARARQFLVDGQQETGYWPVNGTKKDKATRVEPTATYWGTCWAVIGLAKTLAPAVQ